MIDFHLSSERRPSGQDIVGLFGSVGWGKPEDYNIEAWNDALKTGGIILTAYEGEKLVGLLSGFSDKVSESHIMYVIVMPEYQRNGIGSALVRQMLDDCKHTAVYTTSFEESEAFFLKCGLRKQTKLIPFSLPAQST